jgi:hypothetical protein
MLSKKIKNKNNALWFVLSHCYAKYSFLIQLQLLVNAGMYQSDHLPRKYGYVLSHFLFVSNNK